jgi:hypothetical protein
LEITAMGSDLGLLALGLIVAAAGYAALHAALSALWRVSDPDRGQREEA